MQQARRTPGLLIAAGLLVAYVAIGHVWVKKTGALMEPDVLFNADTPRVVWNETSLEHAPGRTVLHPLHVLMTAPLGVPLTGLLGSRELAAVVISALFAAGCVYGFDVLLRRATALALPERMLFVILLGLSAGQVTFAAVPETHVISGFFLTLALCHLALANGDRITELPRSLGDRVRLFGKLGLVQVVLAAGALVTNLLLAPVCVLSRLPRSLSPLRRLTAAIVPLGAAVCLLGALYMAQRALLFGSAGPNSGRAPASAVTAAPAASSSAPEAVVPAVATSSAAPAATAAPAKRGGVSGWLSERFNREANYMTLSPRRLLEVALAIVAYNIYVPRVVKYALPPNPEGYAVSKMTAVRLDYFAFDLSPIAIAGLLAWLSTIALSLVALVKSGSLRKLGTPAVAFAVSWLALYFLVFTLYHVYPIGPESNDIFLFAPDLIVPVLFLVAVAASHGTATLGAGFKHGFRVVLALSTLAAVLNTAIYTVDLLAFYAATPVPG